MSCSVPLRHFCHSRAVHEFRYLLTLKKLATFFTQDLVTWTDENHEFKEAVNFGVFRDLL